MRHSLTGRDGPRSFRKTVLSFSLAASGLTLMLAGGALWAEGTQEPSTQPADGSQTPSSLPSATEMIRALQRDRTIDVPIPPSLPADRPGLESAGPLPEIVSGPEEGPLLPEGTFVVDRPGRLVREGDWWTLVFESADGRVPGQQLLLLPSRQLEIMEQTSRGGARSVVFIVSGEVTEFHGRNYLLLRKVLIRRDLGNLR